MSGTDFTQYRRKQIAELRPWQDGDSMDGISVSAEDAKAGSPKPGDMIARNPKNHADQWLVAAAYFADNFEPLASPPSPAEVEISDEMVEQIVAWVRDDVPPAYDISSEVARDNPELPESARAALRAALSAGGWT